ncbi:MAG: TRAP transporter small permease [bacterium]|nr:TRAP transporter small permease [bacterium]
MRPFLNNLYKWSGLLAATFIASICLLVFAQVILNLIDRIAKMTTGSAIGLAIPSYADFTGFFLAASSFLALAYTLREGGHIRVSLFIQNAGPKTRHVIELWCLALALAVSAYFTWYAAHLVYESLKFNDLSAGMIAVPVWIPQSAMLIGLMILTTALIDEFVDVLKGNDPSYTGKGENLLEGEAPLPNSTAKGD